jgi:hypothetical protein
MAHDEHLPGDVSAHAREGIEHLQGAARELIRAARALLDAAEDLVDDPDAVSRLAASFSSILTSASRGFAAAATPDRDDGTDRVERIRVS